MCGISGIILGRGERADSATLGLMSAALAHRGPDAEGCFIRDGIGLAHRRLKIIDLSDEANQPFESVDRALSLVFNGEIYNYRELRDELRALGRRFRTASDTEVLLEAYAEWGAAAFLKLNGMFAFALSDFRGGVPVTHIVRDRFGVKPLFYCHSGVRFAFASELKPLLALDWVSRELDPEGLFCLLKFSHIPTPRSIFRAIRQVEPGTAITLRDGRFEVNQYYDRRSVSEDGQSGNPKLSEAQWLDQLGETLERVVRRQTVSDVPSGCFLSGGVDSSLLALTFSRIRTEPIRTFTIAYRETEFDESEPAREIARLAGTKHREIPVGPRDLLALVDDLPLYFDQPFADPTLLPTLVLARAAREEVTVALSGDGGDELFFGYDYQRALLKLRVFAGLPRYARRAAVVAASAPIALQRAFGGALRSHRWEKARDILDFEDEAQLFASFIGTIGPLPWDRLGRLLAAGPPPGFSPIRETLDAVSDFPWCAKIDQIFLRTFLPDTVLAKTDRASMAFGLEARVPFLDDEMVSFSSRLPFEYKLRDGSSKYLLRQLLQREIDRRDPTGRSRALVDRKKQGFSIPLRDWWRGELAPLLDRTLNRARLEREGIFNPGEVALLVAEHASGKYNHSHLLFSLVSFQLWKERYLS